MSAPVTQQFVIAATGDDVRRNGATFADDATNELGHFGASLATALRITNVQIKRGARIRQANVRFRAAGAYSATVVNVTIRGDRQPNSPPIPSVADWDARTDTAASVAWANVPIWAADAWYESADFSAVVQEIVNQPAWVPGNALTIYFEDNGSTASALRQARSRNFEAQSAPVMTIEWEDAQNVTTVHLRSPRPPHQSILQLDVSGLSYGEMLMRPQTASFRIPRTDPNVQNFGHLLAPEGEPPMYSIERYDGTHPWVGFLKTWNPKYSDPDVQVTLADHMWRLEDASTRASGTFRGSAGQAIRETLNEMEQRAAPSLYLDLTNVGDGPGLDYEYQAQKGNTFLQQMAAVSGYEWGFRYDVTPSSVNTALRFEAKIGSDKRGEIVFEEGTELQDVGYFRDYSQGFKSALVVGGTGTFATRPTGAATATPAGPGLGGTRVVIERQVTEQEALFNAAARMLDTPEHVAEAITFGLLDEHIAGVNVGDIISCRLPETDLSMPLERAVRVLGLHFDPERGVHRADTQVVP